MQDTNSPKGTPQKEAPSAQAGWISQLKGPRAVLAALSLVVLLLSAAAAFAYSQGQDPLAAFAPLLQTTKATTASAGSAAASTAAASSQEAAASTQAASTGAAASKAASASEHSATSADASEASSSSSSSESINTNNESTDKSSGVAASATQESPKAQSAAATSHEAEVVHVNLTIDGSAAGAGSQSYSLELEPGASVYDALLATGTSVNARATGYGTYVAAIGGLAEKQLGGSSGWVYSVGGVEPQTAASNYTLSDGDTVVWTYVRSAA